MKVLKYLKKKKGEIPPFTCVKEGGVFAEVHTEVADTSYLYWSLLVY